MTCNDSESKLEELKEFASPILNKDRGSARFFSGRVQEIEDVELSIKGVMKRHLQGDPLPASDETWLFQGGPGAGKSALLKRLAERWDARQDEDAPIALTIRADLVINQSNLVAIIADAVATANDDAEASNKLRQIAAVDRSSSTGIGGEFGIKAGTQINEGNSVAANPRELNWESLKNLFPKQDWKRPVILMLDEVQGLSHWSGPSEISNLHQGIHGLPIIPVFAGLSDSFDVLRMHDISRMSRRRRVTLGALEQTEAKKVVTMMLDAFCIEGSSHNDWARRIAFESCGWPQHLHVGLQALAKSVVANDGMLGSIEGEFANSVSGLFAKYRKEYYRDRLDDDLANCVGLIYSILNEARPPGKALGELRTIIEVQAKEDIGLKFQLPKLFDASALLDRMIKRGFLQLTDPDNRYICPIPSLVDYIGELAAK